MGKTRRGHKEYSREQRLIHENQRLKKSVASLRKQLARLDLDRSDYLRDIIEEHYQAEEAGQGLEIIEKLKKEWACNKCSTGHLEINLYNKPTGTHYYRKCSVCPNRTESQLYNPYVKGILKEPKED